MKVSRLLLVVLAVVVLSAVSTNAFALRGVLELTNVTFSPKEASPGQRVTVTITVKNISNGEAPMFYVGVRERGALSSLASTNLGGQRDTIPANQSKTYTVSFNFPQPQASSVTLTAFASCHGGEYGDQKEYVFKAKYVLQEMLTLRRPFPSKAEPARPRPFPGKK